MSNNIEPWQCRAARAALDWSATRLQDESGVSRKTLTEFEGGKRKMQVTNVLAVLSAFERAGAYFDEGGCLCRRAGQSSATATIIPIEDLNAENDE
jgi:transcriptional regulator with XRE-family HTH domain